MSRNVPARGTNQQVGGPSKLWCWAGTESELVGRPTFLKKYIPMAHIWFIEYMLQPAFNNKVSETLKLQIRIEKAVRSFSPGCLPRPSRRLCCIEWYHQVQPERMLVLYPCHVKHGYLRLLKPIQDHLSKSMPNFPFQSPRATGECTHIDTPVVHALQPLTSLWPIP